jgi:hypothetical protein
MTSSTDLPPPDERPTTSLPLLAAPLPSPGSLAQPAPSTPPVTATVSPPPFRPAAGGPDVYRPESSYPGIAPAPQRPVQPVSHPPSRRWLWTVGGVLASLAVIGIARHVMTAEPPPTVISLPGTTPAPAPSDPSPLAARDPTPAPLRWTWVAPPPTLRRPTPEPVALIPALPVTPPSATPLPPLVTPTPIVTSAPTIVPTPTATATSSAPATTISHGTYLVGTDVMPGTYKTTGAAGIGSCYWARLKDTSGNFNAIIANGISRGPITVTISATDGAFTTSGCKTWRRQAQ